MIDIMLLIQTYGYMGLFVTTFLESVILFWLPGDSMIFTAGFLASQGYFHIPTLIVLFIVSSFLAGMAGYYIGRYLHVFHRYSFFRKIIHQAHIDRAKNLIEKKGLLIILVSKFFPLVRTFVPIYIGLTEMKAKTFLIYNLIGSVAASIFFTTAGYYLGQIFPWTQEYMSAVIILIIVLSLLPLVGKIWKHFISAK